MQHPTGQQSSTDFKSPCYANALSFASVYVNALGVQLVAVFPAEEWAIVSPEDKHLAEECLANL